jgi:tRNA dimethylallyltransferase
MNSSSELIYSNPYRPCLIVICGATASGKSGLGVTIGQYLQNLGIKSIVLSADSRQVYREFSIGTAKPSDLEQAQVTHHFVDICEPTQVLSVAEFQAMAQDLIQDCHRQNIVPLLVGGTGLYIKSIVAGMKIPRVAAHPQLRQQLTNLGQPLCYQMLKQVDPQATMKIHANDQVRTLRALEVFYVTGRPLSKQQGEDPPTYPILQIGLDTPEIDQRIAQRTSQMFDGGLVDEVKTLVAKYGEDLPLLNTLGYAEVRQYLRGEVDRDEAIRLTVLHTRQFAKRQRTWFRGTPGMAWFDSNDPDLNKLVSGTVDRFLAESP